MRLGPCVSEDMYPEWRFVETDLYSISDRVKEYDRDCRLAFKENTVVIHNPCLRQSHARIHHRKLRTHDTDHPKHPD